MLLLVAGTSWLPSADAQLIQQGTKLTCNDAAGHPQLGASVALSADGNTAIAGGPGDSSAGAAWVFTRTAGSWTQQGPKLAGAGTEGSQTNQGYAVALSADGNTAIVGAPGDNSWAGSAWVFIRSSSLWKQQGSKLVGTGAIGTAQQGYSVALSADGNTAIIGGPYDNGKVGAAWVFVWSGGIWMQQGAKIVGAQGVGAGSQGTAVALSADGNTAIIAGPNDANYVGAIWAFRRSGDAWSQQGNKLLGTGAYNGFGGSVALSADGNTAVVGDRVDNAGID